MDDLIQNYVGVLRNWSNFSGRARRREYWMFFLGNIALGIVLAIVGGLLGKLGMAIVALFWLVIIVPTIAVSVRRLHDTGRPGWWYLLVLVPFGAFVLLYFFVVEGQPGTNEYGPNPKESLAYAV